jgi:signal peptidase I
MNEQNNTLIDDVQVMKKEQKKLVNKLPVKEYPQEGIGLQDYAWDELFSDDSRENQYAMESDLSSKLSPYFGLPTTLIVLDIPTQTLNIALAGDLTSEDNRQQIKDNITAFAAEAEGISNLTQITFQLNVRDGEKQKQDYSCTFSRENGEDKFLMIQEED